MEPSSERPRTGLGGLPHGGRDRHRSTASPALKGQGAPRVPSVHRRLPGAQTSAWASRPTGAHVVNRPGLARGEENGCRALTGKTTRCYLLGALTGNGSLSICIRHGANASAKYTRHSRKGHRPGPRLRHAHCPRVSAARGLGFQGALASPCCAPHPVSWPRLARSLRRPPVSVSSGGVTIVSFDPSSFQA